MELSSVGGENVAMGKDRKPKKGARASEQDRTQYPGYPFVKARFKRGEQSKMARDLGITESYFSQVLDGSRGVTPLFEMKMAKLLGTTRDGLHGPSNPDLAGYISQLDEDQQRRALRVLKSAFDTE